MSEKKYVKFFRSFPTRMEYLAELYPNQNLHKNMLLMNLKLIDIGCIVDRSDNFLDISGDINCANLHCNCYEVFGSPLEELKFDRTEAEIDREWEQLCADVKQVGDGFEREKWNEVLQFLLHGVYPVEKINPKARENFSRRCRHNYALGMSNADGPTLYFISGGRGKINGDNPNPTLHTTQKRKNIYHTECIILQSLPYTLTLIGLKMIENDFQFTKFSEIKNVVENLKIFNFHVFVSSNFTKFIICLFMNFEDFQIVVNNLEIFIF